MNKTLGGVGTNQYQVQGRSRIVQVPDPTVVSYLDRLTQQDWEDRKNRISQPSCPPAVVDHLALYDPHRLVRAAGVIHSQNSDVVTQAVTDLAEVVRVAALQHQLCVHTTMEQIAPLGSEAELQAIADNPTTPATILSKLASHTDQKLALAVAMHPHTPATALAVVAEPADTSMPVMWALAHRDDTPAAVLRTVWFRAKTARRSGLHGSQPADPGIWVRVSIAQRSTCPIDLIRLAAQDASPQVREKVAYNPRCPVAVLHQLASDRSAIVKRAVASSSKIGEDTLKILIASGDPQVRRAVLAHRRCPDHFRVINALR